MSTPSIFTRVISKVQKISPQTGMTSGNATRSIGTNNVLNTVKTVAQRSSGLVESKTPAIVKPTTLKDIHPVQINESNAPFAKTLSRAIRKTVINASDRKKPVINLQKKISVNQTDISNRPKNGASKTRPGVAKWGASYRDYVSALPINRFGIPENLPLAKAAEPYKLPATIPDSVPKSIVSFSGTEILTVTADTKTPTNSANVTDKTPEDNNSTLFLVGAIVIGILIFTHR